MADSWELLRSPSTYPWWAQNAFRFVAPGGDYDPLQWRQAVLGHRTMKDFVAFLRHCIGEGHKPYYC